MKLKNTLSLLCVMGLMAMALAGCGSSADTTNAASAASISASTSDSSKSSGSEIIGQVQSISDQTITLLLGDMTDPGQNQDGAPAKPAGSSSSSEQPSGEQPSGEQSSGERPDAGQPGGGKAFTAGTETVAVTITDDTVIKVENVSGETDGSIDDIKEGAVLDVTLGDQNTATAVIVKTMAGNPEAPDHAGISAPASSSSSSQSANS